MADEFTRVVVEAAAPRTLVKQLMVNDEAHVDSSHPAVVLALVLEPFIQFGKLTVIEISPRDANAIDVAASLVEGLVGQGAPKVDANEIAAQDGREVRGQHLKKFGKIVRDVLWPVHFLRQNIRCSEAQPVLRRTQAAIRGIESSLVAPSR